MTPKSVFILEHAAPGARGLARLVVERPDLSLHGVAADLDAALEACAAQAPDLLVVDLSVGNDGGVGMIERLRAEHPKPAILALSDSQEPRFVERVLRAGASGYVVLGAAVDEMLRALDRLAEGELYLSEQLSVGLLRRLLSGVSASEEARIERLSDRESEVLRLVGEGLKSPEIAERLGVKAKTVDTYRERIKDKLDLADSHQLYHFAIRWSIRQAKNDVSR